MSKTSESKQLFEIPKVKDIPKEIKSLPIPRDEIEQLKLRAKEKLQFSFKFFDRSIDAFNLAETSRVCDNWFLCLFDSLKDVSDLTRNDLVVERRQHYDAHEHKWVELKYKYPLSEAFLEQVESMQFRISKGRGRVHGFIIGNRFYIVWLDPHHNLYPDDRYGGTKLFPNPDSCYDILDNEIINLKAKITELEKANTSLADEIDSILEEHEEDLKEKETLKEKVSIFDAKKKRQEKYNRKIKKNQRR